MDIRKLKEELFSLYDKRDELKSIGSDNWKFYQDEIYRKIREIENIERGIANPALAKLNADAKEFDRTHGIDEWGDAGSRTGGNFYKNLNGK